MRILQFGLAGLFFVAFGSGCSDLPSNPLESKWKYERVEDKLRDVTDVTATLASNERFQTSGVDYRIRFAIVRQHGSPDMGWFPGQFDCNPQNPVLMRLDDGPIEPVPCLHFDGAAFSVSRVEEATIRRIERAETMFVEMQNQGDRIQVTFDVRGLRL
jgi:hypothetical protein